MKASLKNSLYYILKTKNTDFFFLLFLGGMEQWKALSWRCLISFGTGLFTWRERFIYLGEGVPVHMDVGGQRKALGFVSQILPIFFSPETVSQPAAQEASGFCPHLPRFKVHTTTPSWILGIKIRSPSFQGRHFTTCAIAPAPGFHFFKCYSLWFLKVK